MAIIYDVRVKDSGDDVLEMLYELYTRIDRGAVLKKGTAIIYDARVEDNGSDDILEMLYEL